MEFLWSNWHGHPDVLIGLSLLEGCYLLGVGPLRARYNLASHSDPVQISLFTAGVLVLLLALISPLHHLSNNYLFSAHMLQHVLLTFTAPPLLILGTPAWLLRPIIRKNNAMIAGRIVTHPIVAFLTFNAIFSIWHMPALYNLSVTNHGFHIIEHLLFIGSSVLLWWPIVSIMPELPRLTYPLQMLYLFMLSIAQIIVFAPITFAGYPLYQWYVDAPEIWGVGDVTDQQIGAIIMKVGGGVLFMSLVIVAFFRWSRDENQEQNSYLPVGIDAVCNSNEWIGKRS